ncbi:MAG: MBOAT family protein [Clostridiales bacterium]|nr:MBOAT family protein [Clostridiales bacterium]
MLFASTVFLYIFLPVTLILYYTVCKRSRRAQNILLLLSSLLFYAWGEPVFVLIMIASIVVNYFLGLLIEKSRANKGISRLIIATTVIFNLSFLFVFKYLGFSLKLFNSIFSANLYVPEIALPIGISFFTFQAMSYVFDVYRKKGKVQKNILNVALYISFFPQLIAGPIVRYQTIAEQINNRKETIDNITKGVCRFIIGLGKKVLIANNMAVIADAAFDVEIKSTAFAWLGALCYTLQIYFDFCGYSDMAIGLGKMFGFHFNENFNYPYISKSVSEFWRRWHISLGTWFRDYVYFPLGGSRVKSKARLVFNLFVVWTLTGIWHGANLTFLIWGLGYFVLLAIEKLTGLGKRLENTAIISRIYTLFFVVIGWVIFRSDSISDAIDYLGTMFGLNANSLLSDEAWYILQPKLLFLLFGLLFSFPVAPYISKRLKTDKKPYGFIYFLLITAIFLLSVAFIVKGTYNPFIYFNF